MRDKNKLLLSQNLMLNTQINNETKNLQELDSGFSHPHLHGLQYSAYACCHSVSSSPAWDQGNLMGIPEAFSTQARILVPRTEPYSSAYKIGT